LLPRYFFAYRVKYGDCLVDEGFMAATKTLALRRPGSCVSCHTALAVGVVAEWDKDARTVTCLACRQAPAIAKTPPTALGETPLGESLGREYERRRAGHEKRVRKAHPHIGGLLLAWNDEPQHQRAFKQGQIGELEVADAIEKAVAKMQGAVLHNRRMPGGRGDVDHIAIVPSGVYIIDAKAVGGKVEVRSRWFKPPLLFIAGRDRTKYLDGLDRQSAAVRDALTDTGNLDVLLQAALCFTKADLPLLRTVELRGHLLLYRKALTKRLTAPGPLSPERCTAIAAALTATFRPA
jgi:hypothetical protein